MRACVRACMWVRVRACACVCVRVHACVCVCVGACACFNNDKYNNWCWTYPAIYVVELSTWSFKDTR